MLFLSPRELEKKGIGLINIHYLLFALNYFIEKFDDKVLQQKLFVLYFSVNLTEGILDLGNADSVDPFFYLFKFQDKYQMCRFCFLRYYI